MPSINLAGRPIAITGASSGIGLATALACAAAGMPVALGARRLDRLEAAASLIRSRGGLAVVVETDVTNPNDCRALVARTIAEFGSVYSVFANAGFGLELPIHKTSDAEMRAIFETNFFGTLNTIHPAVDHMLAAGTGHVLICSSCLAKLSIPRFGAYCATKAAQDHIGRAMRVELKESGIHVSTVHPVLTSTEFSEKRRGGGPESAPALRPPQALIQPPERVADAIVRCLRRPWGEVWTSTPTRLLFALADAAPSLTDWLLVRRESRGSRGVNSPDSESRATRNGSMPS